VTWLTGFDGSDTLAYRIDPRWRDTAGAKVAELCKAPSNQFTSLFLNQKGIGAYGGPPIPSV